MFEKNQKLIKLPLFDPDPVKGVVLSSQRLFDNILTDILRSKQVKPKFQISMNQL
jgi:hypothetical protein